MATRVNESVTIVIPTRNRSATLARCLAALPAGARGLNAPEVIVVDDCSNDPTARIVEEFARASGWQAQCLRQERPLGANAARNRGMRIARGEIIVMIDDDAIATEDWLAKLVNGLSRESPVVTGAIRLTIEGPILGKHREEVSTFLSEVLSAPVGMDGVTVPVACNMAAYRGVFDVASFDETVRPPVEEGDWLRRAGVRAGFVPEAWVWHYKTPEEIRLRRILRVAWFRGSEGGWWFRERLKSPFRQRWAMARSSLGTSARAFGHAVYRRCWGGVAVGLGELSRALALVGLINRRARVPASWG
jgi:glycosyltransferase involved in cell wall biosynthesis